MLRFFKGLKESIHGLFFLHNTLTFPFSKCDSCTVAVCVLLFGSITWGSIITYEARDKLTKSMLFSLGCICFAIYNRKGEFCLKGRGMLLVVSQDLFALKH